MIIIIIIINPFYWEVFFGSNFEAQPMGKFVQGLTPNPQMYSVGRI
jgi:hypothetical protein